MNKNLFVSIWFSNLSIDLILMENPTLRDKPFCILRTYKKQKFISKLNNKCKTPNLIEGSKLSDAMIIKPDLIVKKDFPLRKKKLYLNKIIFWLSSITPRISVAKDSTLILDIPYTIRRSCIKKMQSFLRDSNITAKIGIANTVGAAWAKSHFPEKNICRNSIDDSITNLPIKSLRISHSSVEKLNNVGIETINQLEKIPKNELYLRFDSEVSSFFDKATGKADEPLTIVKIEPKFHVKIDLVRYLNCKYQIINLTKKLIKALCIELKNSHMRAQTINIIFNSEKDLKKIIKVRSATPTNSDIRIVNIFATKLLEQKDLPEILSIKVEIPETYPVIEEQEELLDSKVEKEKTFTKLEKDSDVIYQLVEKLKNRLGEEAVRVFSPRESHIPEKSYIFTSPANNLQIDNWPIQHKARPKILFEPQPIIMLKQISKLGSDKPPRLFSWGGQKYEISKAIGPERISSNWWLVKKNHENAERHYWQVKSTCGSHFWLFNSRKNSGVNDYKDTWLIQGQFC